MYELCKYLWSLYMTEFFFGCYCFDRYEIPLREIKDICSLNDSLEYIKTGHSKTMLEPLSEGQIRWTQFSSQLS